MSAARPRWIWLPGAPRGTDVFCLARRTFMVDETAPARVRISCDGRYALYVDGSSLGRGPVRSEPRDLTFDEYELSLEAGAHVICTIVRHYGRPTLYWKPGATERGGLWVDGAIVTDETWRVMRATYQPQEPGVFGPEGAPDAEVVDGRAWPHGWLDAAFDDSSWKAAIRVDGPAPLRPRPIPMLAERTLDLGTFALRPGHARTLDLGTITNAHVSMDLEAAAGTTIEVTAGEELSGEEVLLDVRNWSMRYTAAGVEDEGFEAFEPVGFRYLRVSADGRARVAVRALERTYPREPGAHFSCSDPALTAIWEAGVRTLELCSTDAFIDCPSREQRAWLGDDYINTLVSFVSNPDVALVVRDLRLHAAAQRPDGLLPMVAAADFTDRAHTLPDASLLWVCTLARVYEHTADAALVDELLPVAMRILDAFEAMRAPGGLLAGYVHGIEGWWFIDWAQIERGDHIAAVDAMYAMALRDAMALPGVNVDDLRARHAATRDAFARTWDEARGCYVDAAWLDGSVGRRVSQQTNSAAICGDLVPPGRVARVIERITDPARLRRTRTPGDGGTFAERLNRQWERPPDFDDDEHVVEAQPFFAHFLHRAFARTGRTDLMLSSIRRWREMVARNGLVEEYWSALPGMGSRCHSWAGTPTYDLIAHVLGARPAEPGWASITVEPHLGDLQWAEARIPTPRGWLRVRAEHGRAPEVSFPDPLTTATSSR